METRKENGFLVVSGGMDKETYEYFKTLPNIRFENVTTHHWKEGMEPKTEEEWKNVVKKLFKMVHGDDAFIDEIVNCM